MPSLSEGFGIANLEAMACGRPVISTKVGGIVDVVINGETGILVEPANSNDLYIAMKRLVNNPELAETMGKRSRKRVVENFTWDVVTQNLNEAYDFILKT